MKAEITQKKIKIPKKIFVNYVRAGTSSSLQYFIWLKSKTAKIYSVVTFDFKYTFKLSLGAYSQQTVETLIRHSLASDLCLYCFPMPHKKDARVIWENMLLIDIDNEGLDGGGGGGGSGINYIH